MLTLYTKPGCSFCAQVKEEAIFLGIEYNERSIADEGVIEELVKKGGERHVPFLIDDEAGVSMYGSDKIIAHLHKRFK
ncbi:MAG TPA: glutathione S-transferase N-terminal domain-containing protein [Candidatus Paceibacterota bacterium]